MALEIFLLLFCRMFHEIEMMILFIIVLKFCSQKLDKSKEHERIFLLSYLNFSSHTKIFLFNFFHLIKSTWHGTKNLCHYHSEFCFILCSHLKIEPHRNTFFIMLNSPSLKNIFIPFRMHFPLLFSILIFYSLFFSNIH
jgi:hypothetical protein